MPDTARPYALGLLQALSAVGNITAAVINIGFWPIARVRPDRQIAMSRHQAHRMAADVRRRHGAGAVALCDSPSAQRARALAGRGARGVARQSSSARTGSCLATRAGAKTRSSACAWRFPAWSVCGGSASLAPTWCARCLRKHFRSARADRQAEVEGKLFLWTGITSVMQNFGGFFGIYAFSRGHACGRSQTDVCHRLYRGDVQHGTDFFWYIERF